MSTLRWPLLLGLIDAVSNTGAGGFDRTCAVAGEAASESTIAVRRIGGMSSNTLREDRR
jgi:hypothetical protein